MKTPGMAALERIMLTEGVNVDDVAAVRFEMETGPLGGISVQPEDLLVLVLGEAVVAEELNRYREVLESKGISGRVLMVGGDVQPFVLRGANG